MSTVLVIPSLHPSPEFPELVAQLQASGLTDVLVIDDGSGAAYSSVFDSIAAREGCTVLTHEENLGKGAALKTAMRHVLERPEVTGIVTADSDGQHGTADILRVSRELDEAMRQDERVCVLGVRDFDQPDLPTKSRLGNHLTTGVVKLLLGRDIPDTQTGLRGFSRQLLPELLEVRGTRFEYEMNALMWMLGHQVRVDEVPIETIYHDQDNSQTHFRPVQDSVRIYGHLFAQAAGFVLTSLLGFVVDVVLFAIIIDSAFNGASHLTAVATATVAARIVSALVNFALNRKLVFQSREKASKALVRYFTLAVGILAASATLTTVVAWLLQGHVVWAKILVDGCLFAVSYLLQRRWVFAHPRSHAVER